MDETKYSQMVTFFTEAFRWTLLSIFVFSCFGIGINVLFLVLMIFLP